MAAGEPAEDAWVSHGGVETTRHRKNEMGLRGFRKAVYATGAMKQYARRVGNSRPLAPGLMGSPAARELSVDTVMDVARDILWPDDAREERSAGADDIDEIRAQEYSLLAMLLSRAPGRVALNRISQLRGDMTPLGVAHGALAQIALEYECGKSRAGIF